MIDEEQRFGVAHKERLKQMRREVDVLTMTATPIPRTLYMSLSGIRDMSVIDTPPENRVAVKTLVTEYDESLIRKAILREMDRGGQIYYVHNRVQDIELVAAELHRIVPEAGVLIGHGQMPEDELAQVMLGFAQGEGNILLCTTIIENGLDIPNVNTIIIDHADHFGLSQLYQLRGRVGRGIDRAYAYLLFKPPLTEIARQRLDTIQEASELGAGYRVAMRDMEIRGAGELLGAEQHGHIAAIGFDLYTRLLRRAIEELQQSAGERGDAMRRAQDERPARRWHSISAPASTFPSRRICRTTMCRTIPCGSGSIVASHASRTRRGRGRHGRGVGGSLWCAARTRGQPAVCASRAGDWPPQQESMRCARGPGDRHSGAASRSRYQQRGPSRKSARDARRGAPTSGSDSSRAGRTHC